MSLKSFRAFDGPFELDLDGGMNLVPKMRAGKFPYQVRVKLVLPKVTEVPKKILAALGVNSAVGRCDNCVDEDLADDGPETCDAAGGSEKFAFQKISSRGITANPARPPPRWVGVWAKTAIGLNPNDHEHHHGQRSPSRAAIEAHQSPSKPMEQPIMSMTRVNDGTLIDTKYIKTAHEPCEQPVPSSLMPFTRPKRRGGTRWREHRE
jgi:hypothetical protein